MNSEVILRIPYKKASIVKSAGKYGQILGIQTDIAPVGRFNISGRAVALEPMLKPFVRETEIVLFFNIKMVLNFYPERLDFENVRVGNILIKRLSLSNVGNVPLAIHSVGTENHQFGIQNWPSEIVVISPGDNKRVSVQFKPSAIGTQKSSVRITTEESEAILIPVSGVGSESDIVIDSVLEGRILAFFNSVTDPYQIVRRIRDDPQFLRRSSETYGVRISLARRIVAYRNNLPYHKFTTINQINEITGVGIDTFHDILYTF